MKKPTKINPWIVLVVILLGLSAAWIASPFFRYQVRQIVNL